jgi:hypothetical protein
MRTEEGVLTQGDSSPRRGINLKDSCLVVGLADESLLVIRIHPTGKFAHIRNRGMAKIMISLSAMQWGGSRQTLTEMMRGRGAR